MTTPTPELRKEPRKSLIKVLVPTVVILGLAVGGLYLVKSQLQSGLSSQVSASDIREGAVLPDFEVQVLGGEKKNISQLGAKVVMVNFWATWCEACIIEMPSIVELRRSYKDRGFEVMAVNLDEKPESVVPKVLKQMKIDFPVFVDQDGAISELFDVHAIPLTVLIDANRKILLVHNGEHDWNGADVRSRMELWLSE